MGESVTAVTDAEFESQVLKSEKPVLVDFWASWCGPCRMVAPVVEDLAGEMGDRVRILAMDIDSNPSTPGRLGIMSLPTLIIFKDGRPTDRTIGYRSNLKGELKQKLEALI